MENISQQNIISERREAPMTSAKIETILSSKFGISDPMDCWLKLPQITAIYLHEDPNIYINDYELYYFNTDTKALYISRADSYPKLEQPETSFGAYPISAMFQFDSIAGFISSTEYIGLGSFHTKMVQ